MEMQQVTFVSVPFISAIIAGKWAMELGFSQIRQLIWMLGGLLLGPLALLVLYVQLLNKQREAGMPGGAAPLRQGP